MVDIKLQVYRGESGPGKVDFRKSTGEFLGSPDDEHRTVLEYRADDDVDAEEIGSLTAVNFLLERMTVEQPQILEQVADITGLHGDGPIKIAFRIYDND